LRRHLFALVAGLLPFLAAGAETRAEPAAQRSACSGIYTGSARGIFWCRVVAVHDSATNLSTVQIELTRDVQLGGDALVLTPGGLEWSGPITPGTHALGDASVTSAWSYLRTGLPPNPADYVAAKAWSKYPVDQGQVSIVLKSVTAGSLTSGFQTFEVHGTISARLLPLSGREPAVGDVRVTATF
jgi:hypothetical protein